MLRALSDEHRASCAASPAARTGPGAGQRGGTGGHPVPPQGELAALLALSDERDTWTRRLLAAWQQGYAAGAAGQFDAGYAAAIADVKAAEHALPDYLNGLRDTEERRWALRGETRTRATFADPHHADRNSRKHDVL